MSTLTLTCAWTSDSELAAEPLTSCIMAGMKVVLFCGGMGMRLRDYSDQIPKPLVDVGHRPILWHLMRYYAHFGHREFILCLGHGGMKIKEYFLEYNESIANDFVLVGGSEVELLD